MELQLVLVLELDHQVVDGRNCPRVSEQYSFQQENQQLNQREMIPKNLQDPRRMGLELMRVWHEWEQWIFERKKLEEEQNEQVRVRVQAQLFEERLLWVEEQERIELEQENGEFSHHRNDLHEAF